MATPILDYSGLQQRIIDEVDRDDLGTVIPNFIYEAEQEIYQDLRVRVMQRRYNAVTPTSGRYMTLPDRYLDMYRVFLTQSGRPKRLRVASPAEIIEHYGPQGVPTFFSVTGLELEFERPPGQQLPIEMTFYQAPYNLGYQAGNDELNVTPPKIDSADLDDDNVVINNAVLRLFPHIYLYGSMVKAALYTNDRELEAKYGEKYGMAILKANRNAKEGRITGGPIAPFNSVGSP